MKKWSAIIGMVVGLVIATTAMAGDVFVRGYTRSDGTYVRPHYRTSPNSTTLDNWSTRGNVNPYTGQPGTRSRSPMMPNTLGGYQPLSPKPLFGGSSGPGKSLWE